VPCNLPAPEPKLRPALQEAQGLLTVTDVDGAGYPVALCSHSKRPPPHPIIYSYQPGDLIASLKKMMLWPIHSWALCSFKNCSIIARDAGVAVVCSRVGIRCSVRSSG